MQLWWREGWAQRAFQNDDLSRLQLQSSGNHNQSHGGIQ
jgi:hypothetical protein